MKPPLRLSLLTVLSTLGFLISGYLAYHFYAVRGGGASFHSLCNLNSQFNCDAVAASAYADFFGIPVASLGGGLYLALVIASLTARNAYWRREAVRFALILTAIGCLFSLAWFYVMAAMIHQFCLFCLGHDALILISFGIVLSLKPESLKSHPVDRTKWKPLLGFAVASVIATVLAFKMFEAEKPSPEQLTELMNKVLESPVVSVGDGPEFASIGLTDPKTAPVTIVKFSDFQCPHCKIGALTVKAVMERFPGKIRFVFRNFPLDSGCNRVVPQSMHPAACDAARIALCSVQQHQFEPTYHELFEHQDDLKVKKAIDLIPPSLDRTQLLACLANSAVETQLTRDVEEGIRLDINSTPTFFINGHKMLGVYPFELWIKIIEALLKQNAAHS